jgi:hypothetical protein
LRKDTVGRLLASIGIIYRLLALPRWSWKLMFYLCQRLGYFTDADSKPILSEVDDISKMLASLVAKIS